MQLLRLAQLYKAKDLTKEQKIELARKIDTNYYIPNDTYKDLQNKSYTGYNCLHIAAMTLDSDFIHEFVNRGADVLKQGTQNGKTPLHIAVDVKTNCKGRKIWQISGKLQNSQIVNKLLLAHVKSNNTFNPKSNNGISHLHTACMFNCVEAVEFFLKNGEAINQVTNSDALWPSYSLLHFAIRYSCVETAEILLKNGADLFAKDAEGTSPLQILINRLIDVSDYVNMGQRAISIPYEEELKRLERIAGIVLEMKSGSGVDFLDDSGLKIFHVACVLRDSTIAPKFLNDNVDLKMCLKSDSIFWPGWTALHFAACASAETVKLLMRKGADITIKNKRGETPLDMCLKRYTPEMVHSILSTKNEFKSILLSDVSTTLLDLILAMNDMKSFNIYLEQLIQTDICVCPISPLLPGYSLLHLSLSMNERMKLWEHFLAETDSQENVDSLPQVYTCTEDESRLYSDRIHACLLKGCSVALKNFDGLTPIHFAFKTHVFKLPIIAKLLKYCVEDSIDPDNLSLLHIASASGNQTAVKLLLYAGANINTTTTKSFEWYKKSYRCTGKIKPYLFPVSANSTPLHVAVVFKQEYVAKILLDNFADVFALDSEGYTPIHLSMAQSNGSNDIAKAIVGKPKELIDLVTKEGLSHLHVAAFAGEADAIRKLVRNGADVNRSTDFPSRFAGKTPLQILTQTASTQITTEKLAKAVEALIESGADVYANDTLQCLMRETKNTLSWERPDFFDLEALRERQQRRRQRIQELSYDFSQHYVKKLKLNGNVKEPIDSSGLTLLHVACSKFDVDWTMELLNKGANVNARIRIDDGYKGLWKGYTPLHALASRRKSISAMIDSTADRLARLLLDRGADVMVDSVDGTPLHLAYGGYIKDSQAPDAADDPNAVMFGLRGPTWLLDYCTSQMAASQTNCHVDPTNVDGLSHFHLYCMSNDTEGKVKQYLDSGVDVDRSTNPFSDTYPGYTGLHFAFAHRAFNVVNLLIQRGANVRAENAHGNTPLHLMVLQGMMDNRRGYVLALQSHGANFKARNLLGQTPIDILMTKHFSLDKFEYLLEKGSQISLQSSSSSPGPAGLIIKNAARDEQVQIFKLFVGACDIRTAVKNGYDPISEVVAALDSLKDYQRPTFEFFVDVVQQLVDAGCEIHYPCDKGDTELHKSILVENSIAVNAWLLFGADINACEVNSQMFDPDSLNKVEELLALQVYKMKLLGFYVNRSGYSVYNSFITKFPRIDASIDIRIRLELEKAKAVKVTKNLSARAFMSELWAVLYYSKLPVKQRAEIDAFFRRIAYLYKQFPALCGLMMLQYKKALVRSKLIEPAKEVLVTECDMDLPDPCLECLLNYLSNDELKYLIENSEETENPCKRPRIE